TPHVITDLAPVENNKRVRGDILRIDAGGGGIFVYEALSAATRMLLSARAGTRHIILFADAADSEEPGNYQELLGKCKQANITVSVVGLGTSIDQDAELLRDVARRGGGRSFFTDNPEELPRLFAQDTFVVARNTFLDELTSIQLTQSLVTMTGKQFEARTQQSTGSASALPLQIGGYNLCYLRPNANLAAITLDEYKAPIVAAWQAGTGRVLNYTGEADGIYTGPIADWKDVGDFFASMTRWVAGDSGNLPRSMLITQEVKNGIYEVQLHLDPEREIEAGLTNLPKITILRGTPGAKPTVQRTQMQWTSTDTLAAEISLHGNETVLATVEAAGTSPFSLSPVTLPYSPEFKPMGVEDGSLSLEHLARATGGSERVDLAGIWKDLPKQPRRVEMGPWLLILAVVLFLLEVLERRTGLLSIKKFHIEAAGSVPTLPTQRTEGKRQRAEERETKGTDQPPLPALNQV
ncbi:MAG: VWA domain-containing protein, partial [Nitrospira sp.]|nr:VWA domain-containing protein [Nitrospira sp.]